MDFLDVTFKRDHHNAILNALRTLDGDFLLESKCFFGGGTAITLDLGEYRESIDIGLMCSDVAGYRALRAALAGQTNLNRILREGSELECLRDIRADQYGLRTIVKSQNTSIKFEIVRERRFDLEGSMDARYGLPVLSRPYMYAERLLANSDHWYQSVVHNRDIIDLSVMISRWGPIPDMAWEIAEEAYGDKARSDFDNAVDLIRKPEHIELCADKLRIDDTIVQEIIDLHGGAYPREPSPFD